jgi:hypothetical protein
MLISEALQDALREKNQIEKENEELKKVLNEIYAMIAKAIKY